MNNEYPMQAFTYCDATTGDSSSEASAEEGSDLVRTANAEIQGHPRRYKSIERHAIPATPH